MKLKRIKLKNYLRYTDFEHEFLNTPLIGIVGRNGSGKTSLIESIIYGLFGSNRDSDRMVKNRYVDSKEMLVEQEWLINNHNLIVKRGIDNKDRPLGEVWLNNERVVSNYSGVTPYIEKFLGLSDKIFLASSFCRQGNFDSLTNQNIGSAGRKNMFSEILGLDIYSLTEERIKNSLNLLESEMQTFTFIIEQSKQEIANLKREDPSLKKQELEKQKQIIETQLLSIDNEKKELTKEYDKYRELELKTLELKNLQNYISISEKNLADNLKSIEILRNQLGIIQKDLLESQVKNKDLIKIEISEDLINKKNTAQRELGFLQGKILEIEKQINRINQLIGECPNCLQKLSEEAKIVTLEKLQIECKSYQEKQSELSISLNTFQNQIDNLTLQIDKISLAKKEYEVKLRLLTQQEKEKTDELREKEKLADSNTKSYHDNSKEFSKLVELLKNFDTIKFQEIKTRLSDLEITKDKFQKELQSLLQSLERYKIQEEKLKELEQKMLTFENKLKYEFKKNMDVLVILKKIFSRDGIVTSIMKNILVEIEEYSNYIIKKVLPNFYIKFETQLETKKGTVKDGLDIEIYDNNQKSAYSLLSGGEQDLINVALNLGIAFLVRHYSKSPFDMIVLDEVFRHLDDINVEKLTELINGLQENFSQIFVISHKPFVQNIFPVIFNVYRNGLYSEVSIERN